MSDESFFQLTERYPDEDSSAQAHGEEKGVCRKRRACDPGAGGNGWDQVSEETLDGVRRCAGTRVGTDGKDDGSILALSGAFGEEESGGIDLHRAITQRVDGDNNMRGVRLPLESQLPPTDSVATLVPALVAVGDVGVPIDDDIENALRKLMARHTALLKRGYRVTKWALPHARWEHPKWGIEEHTPDGRWWFSTHPADLVNKADSHE